MPFACRKFDTSFLIIYYLLTNACDMFSFLFIHSTTYVLAAETQSKIFQNLLKSELFQFTEDEQTIVSRGRNAGASSGGRKRGPKRLYSTNDKSEGGGPELYQDSTAMECLIGYLYLTDKERCAELIEFIGGELDKIDDDEGVAR